MTDGKGAQSVADGPKPWASGAIGRQPLATLEALQRGLTVDLIATKRSDFVTCAQDESLTAVIERNRHNNFDHLPVLEAKAATTAKDTRIVGLFEIVKFMHSTAISNPVGTVMRPLSEDNLIGADASILNFVRDADIHRCRLIVSGREISGLVSLSDLQRLPVRAALFGLVTHLEILMTNVIRTEFGASLQWMDRLSSGRQQIAKEKIDVAKEADTLVDTLLFTQFSDKVVILRKRTSFPWGSRSKFESELAAIQELRDRLAHANEYAHTRDSAVAVCNTVRLIEKWNGALANWLRDSSQAQQVESDPQSQV
jgi:CBS domain-containing protein